MTIEPETLSSIAIDYTKDMTSIRGRRVQRLLKREFAGAECVLLAKLGNGMAAVLGISESGAALCATDGTGRQAPIVRWLHGSDTAFETQYDLLKDSLPVVSSTTVPLAGLRARWAPLTDASSAFDWPRDLFSRVLDALR